MRILFITCRPYLPERVGGVESSINELCPQFMLRNNDVAVLSSISSHGALSKYNALRRKICRVAAPKDKVCGYPVFRGIDLVKGFHEILKSYKPHVVFIKNDLQSDKLYEELLNHAVFIVCRIHDIDHNKSNQYIISEKLLYLANSKYTAKIFNDKFSLNTRVFPPLVMPELYKTKTTGKVVTHIGLREEKGLSISIELAKMFPGIPFNFYESWPVPKKQFKKFKALEKEIRNITFFRKVFDMRKVYGKTKILLVPSMWKETWGRVATEAQVSGIPVIASDIGGLPEAVGPGGILISPESSISVWGEALRKLWGDDNYYQHYSTQAYKHSQRKEIQPSHLIDELINCLEQHLHSAGTYAHD